jgi:membrane glycosyltransferase
MSRRLRLPALPTRRVLFGTAVAGTTALGVATMAAIVQAGGITLLELAILALFAPTFGWVALAFWNAVAGFLLLAARRDPLSLERVAPRAGTPRTAELDSRTAVVMPAYHEDPERLVRGLGAVARSLAATGRGDAFDLFLLSDTTDEERAEAEEAAWEGLRREREELSGGPGLFYRRRRANVGRKAGNIEDFCRRWGGRYDFMVVLDADSVMDGEVLVELAATLEANPDVGLVQTVPLPARQETRFGRLLQFAAALYSPMLAAGQAFWQGDTANYWGHNAIVRVDAFMEHCRLPVLPGRPPLGGPILSHDFVEAALLRRGGWRVVLRPLLGGSFEEVPGNVVDYAVRDRRWAQGSLQHLRLLAAPGFHPLSRLHLLLGAMGYVASLLWLLILLASTLYVAAPGLSATPLLPGPMPWLSPLTGLSGPVSLLGATAVLLFLPKGLGLLLALREGAARWGGRGRLLAGAALELVFSVVLAPVMMLYHSAFVVQILAGREIRWDPQPRDGRAVGWREAVRRTAPVVAVGGIWASFTLWTSPLFFLWLTPIFAGLLLATPLVRWSSRRGRDRRADGLFRVPWEVEVPEELRDAPPPAVTPMAAGTGAAPSPATPREAPRPMPAQILHRDSGGAPLELRR